jgi:hypothetical protein
MKKTEAQKWKKRKGKSPGYEMCCVVGPSYLKLFLISWLELLRSIDWWENWNQLLVIVLVLIFFDNIVGMMCLVWITISSKDIPFTMFSTVSD